MQRGAIQLLTTAGQLLGEAVSGLIAGGAGILAYRSVTAALWQRGAVAVRPFRERR
ncbi:MAG TPA: hypothetical protein VGU71_09400 [Candidatus Dormibacteraeota bacterium]|nr:hypothetical protein [Candidatus Dormibacteraeota bacterium]